MGMGALIPEELLVQLPCLGQVLDRSPMIELVSKVVRSEKKDDAFSAVFLFQMLLKTGAGQIVLEHVFQSTIHT